MGERGNGADLAFKARERTRISGQPFGKHLDRHLALEPRVLRPVDLSHPARAEQREDLVGAEAGAGRERQDFGRLQRAIRAGLLYFFTSAAQLTTRFKGGVA